MGSVKHVVSWMLSLRWDLHHWGTRGKLLESTSEGTVSYRAYIPEREHVFETLNKSCWKEIHRRT